MSGECGTSHTLIVFGGSIFDFALATDFVAIAKKLMADGLQPTCLSGTDLRDVMEIADFSLVFGREDLGFREEVYTRDEAKSPFYTMASPNGLKSDTLAWISNQASVLKSGDRLLIIFVSHGQKGGGDLKLITGRQFEFLTKSETIAAVSLLPLNTRVTILNEACYSGHWAAAAPQTGVGRNVLVECASQETEPAQDWLSGSGTYRRSLFAVAWMRELTFHPDGQLSQHVSRIEEELDLVPLHQHTNKPNTIAGTRSWLSHKFSHFVISPIIATAIQNAASEQHRHEDYLRARADARRSWKTLWNSVASRQGVTNSAANGDANGDGTTDANADLIIIKDYLNELGSLAQDMNRAALVNMCCIVLRGGGGNHGLRGKVVHTILWQELQDFRVEALNQHLMGENLIVYDIDPENAANSLNGYAKKVVLPIIRRFNEIPETTGLQIPVSSDCIDVFYEDAFQRLVKVLACNKLLQPKTFDFGVIQQVIVGFLREY